MSRNNNSISDETLLGYLLFALPEQDQQQIDRLALSDPIIQQRIQDLRGLLDPLRGNPEEFEPRAGLASSTMSAIRESIDSDVNEMNRRVGSVSMSQPRFESSRATRLAWLDSFVALAAGVVILSFLLPSVWLTRESARRISCAANMREIGEAITAFAYGNSERRLPKIELSGPLSFAGVYAIRLKDAGLLDSSEKMWCPSMSQLDAEQKIPTIAAYLAASPTIQNNWKYTAAGNYSYNLGNLVTGIYITPSIESGHNFAVMGDTLLPIDSSADMGPIHGRNAANILFVDGSIRYVRVDRIDPEQMDNPYLNRANRQSAGVGIEDCCLGPSFQNPFVLIQPY